MKKTTYAWFAKPNSGEYRKIDRSAYEHERGCFVLYAGITERSTDERFSGGYKFRYHTYNDRDLDYPEDGKYTIRKREINLVNKSNVPHDVPEIFKEQLYINAVREAADYLKKHNIKAKVGNVSNPVGDYRDALFEDWCDDYNGGYHYDKEVYDKIIKEVTAYHKEAYLKPDKQNSYDAQLRETYKEAAADICREAIDAAQRAVEAAGNSLDKVDELLKENEKLKEEKDQMEYEYLLTIGKLMCRLDKEELEKFIKNDNETARFAFGALVNKVGLLNTVTKTGIE
tara:strand:- start:150 stop:1004 length:855 start_codon:yes stop_codon:yes gene_type:complete